ncbi:MAG: glycosyltransferase family 4 protein [Candidatus Odinarchaeota archaeon]
MDKLNICLVSLTFAPDSQDGAAKFFTGIYNYLKKQGHNIKLITGKWNLKFSDPNIFQINIIRKRFLWFPQFIYHARNYIRTHKFDIIHGNGPKGVLPIILANQKRFISTIHDLGPFETRFTRIPFEKLLIKYTANKSTFITTCADSIKKQLKYYIPELNINNIFNLYSAIEDKFRPLPEQAQELKNKLNIKGPVLLYIGRIAKYKGIKDIIKAYQISKEQIPNLNLVIGGKPDFSMEKKYKEWQQKYKDIHFIGFISEKEIPIYYSMGDIFVTYSYASEGFGLTPIEAIACGTPVICSSIGAFKEVLGDHAIFVPPKNPLQLAEEIILLLKDDNRRKILIENGKNFIQKYSWNAVGKKLEDVYLKFLNQI